MARSKQRHVFRSLIADAKIDSPYGGWLIFYPDGQNEYHFEIPRGAFEKLGRQISDELKRVSPRARRGASAPSATSRNK